MDVTTRLAFAKKTAAIAAAFAHEKFKSLDQLTIERKGHQDLVSEADRETETLIRNSIASAWPDDGIIGEEHGRKHGTSGYDWVIDPIDGTANYVSGIPHWCVVLACTYERLPVLGVIHDPNAGEVFSASKGGGAHVNDKPLKVADGDALSDGSIATGTSGRSDNDEASALVGAVLHGGGMYFRSASGALMLAYVAAGRLLGYIEDHMNSWDCFAALLMVTEAGGEHLPLDAQTALEDGTRLVAGAPGVYPDLVQIAETVYGD
jgi:myo-inositol-1(or 4)-monophosphatase